LWLIKVWFSASTFVVEIATFAKRQNVGNKLKKNLASIENPTEESQPHILAHSVFAITQGQR
jgi:hypothetical protein